MKKHVYILGGGFGGLYAALELERLLGKDSGVEITLVNRDNFFLFTPMLHEVAASGIYQRVLSVFNILAAIAQILDRVNWSRD